MSSRTIVQVKHIYESDSQRFESAVNTTLRDLVGAGAVIEEIRYASDAALSERHNSGYGALIVFEIAVDKAV
jgi:hypothetical protein